MPVLKAPAASRNQMPSVRKLISYYSGETVTHKGQVYSKAEEFMEDMGVDNYIFISDKTPTCMACGYHKGIQRAHVQPLCEGGDHKLSNIHLLCRNCHVESEHLSGESYWSWMRAVNTNQYKPFYQRMSEMFEAVAGKPATSDNLREHFNTNNLTLP